MAVAPHAGAWIETIWQCHIYRRQKSLPMRERGLKLDAMEGIFFHSVVAPHAGAWIETFIAIWLSRVFSVAPHAGAWIETHCY